MASSKGKFQRDRPLGDIIDLFREEINKRGGGNGFRTLRRLMLIMDDNGDGRLSRDEFKNGLKDYGIDLSATEFESLFSYFDRDRNGNIDFTEFLVGIAGDLNPRRKALVKMAFDKLDTDKSGFVDIAELLAVYDMRYNPDVQSGKKTIQEAMQDFMSQWETVEADGQITLTEFEEYYKGISASIDGDDYFELMIRNAWRMAGGKGQAANTANKRVLVTHKDGRQTVEVVEDELGLRQGDKSGIQARLGRQGISDVDVELHGGYQDKLRKGKGNIPAAVLARDVSKQRSPRNAWADDSSSLMADLGSAGPGDRSGAPVRSNAFKGAARGVGNVAKAMNRMKMPSDVGNVTQSVKAYGLSAPKISPRPNSASNGSRQSDPFEILRKLLYDPPVSLEGLGSKLQISVSSYNPTVTSAGFKSRLQAMDPSLNSAVLNHLWSTIDPDNKLFIELGNLHTMLSARFGKDKTGMSSAVLDKVKAKILERCGGPKGVKGLSRIFNIFDDDNDKSINKAELKSGLQTYGIELNLRELDDVFNAIDKNRSGAIDVGELILFVRGSMSDYRLKLVKMAFDKLDTDGSGIATLEEMAALYDVSHLPEVKNGSKTKERALRDFIKSWDTNEDGTVEFDEFVEYYNEMSATIEDDDYFELMIRNAWRISGGKGMAANSANKRVLVTHKDGRQTVETVENDLGLRAGDKDAIKSRLGKQGFNDVDVELHGGYNDKKSSARGALSASAAARLGRR